MFSWSMSKYCLALACAAIALIGASLSLVACSDSIEIVEDPVQVKLWNDLNDKRLSVDQIEDILRQALDSGVTYIYGTYKYVLGTEIRKFPIARLLALKEVSVANCTEMDIYFSRPYMFGNEAMRDNRNNEGIMKFAGYYSQKLLDLCAAEQDRVILKVMDFDTRTTELLEKFAKLIVKSTEQTRAARDAMNKLREDEEFKDKTLLRACEHVVKGFPKAGITGESWGLTQSLESETINEWLEIRSACSSLLQPLAKPPRLTSKDLAFAPIALAIEYAKELDKLSDQLKKNKQQQ